MSAYTNDWVAVVNGFRRKRVPCDPCEDSVTEGMRLLWVMDSDHGAVVLPDYYPLDTCAAFESFGSREW